MENYLKCDLDDILFEHRNRAYGAYALRKAYAKRIQKASFAGLAFFLLLVSSPLIAVKITPKKLLVDNTYVKLIEPPKPDIKKPVIPPPTPPPPMKKIAMTRFTMPRVTLETEKEPIRIVPPSDSSVQIGNKNIEGEKTTAYIPPSVPTVSLPPPPEKNDKKVVEDPEFIVVEQQPEFKDGLKALYRFLSDNIKYPAVARESSIEGTVYVGFVVGRDGTIRDVAVKRGLGGGLNEEAVRVIQLMPKWNPGKQNGKAVSVAFTLPIKFRLE
jgi:periplasmic protein TonB